jgi:glycosyltransferase involved in cell wall biosynthesis
MTTERRPRVLIVGGPDVHRRLDLMRCLRDEYDVSAAGSSPALRSLFDEAGFVYYDYTLGRGVNPWTELAAFRELRRLVSRTYPDIVHAFATKPSVWGRLAASAGGVPVVIGTLPGLGSLYTDHGARKRLIRRVYQRLQRRASHRSTMTIFQHARDEAEMVAEGVVPRDRTAVIAGSGVHTEELDPRAVDPETALRLRRDFGFDAGDTVVTMVSRVIRSKGVLEFAGAAAALREEDPGLRFLLVGPPDGGSLDRLTPEELELLSEQVTWAGERKDVREILAATDVFALPTRYREGVPRVLLEAASMGLPLVATRSGGCGEVARDGENGFLVEPGRVDDLARAIARLGADEGLRERFGTVSRAIAVQEFDYRVTAGRTAELYRRLLEEERGEVEAGTPSVGRRLRSAAHRRVG